MKIFVRPGVYATKEPEDSPFYNKPLIEGSVEGFEPLEENHWRPGKFVKLEQGQTIIADNDGEQEERDDWNELVQAELNKGPGMQFWIL